MLSLTLTLPDPALALRVQAGLESQTNSELEQNLSQGSPTQSSADKPQEGSAAGREKVSRRAFLKAAVAAAVPSVQTPSQPGPSPQRSIALELLPEELMRLTPTFLKRGLDNAPSGYYVAVVGEGEEQRVVTGTAFGLELDRAFEANREEIVEGTVYGMADWIADAAIDYGHDRDWVKGLGEVLWNVTTEFNKMAGDPKEAFSHLDLLDPKLDVRENRLPLGLIFDSGKEGSKVYIVTADGRILHQMDVARQLGELVKKGVLRKGTEKSDVAKALREILPAWQYESLKEGDEAEKLVEAEKKEKREKIAEREGEGITRQLQRAGLKALIKAIIQEKAKKPPPSPSAAGLEEARAAQALAAELWSGVMVTPAHPNSRKLLPVFADRGTFSAIPLAIRGELGVLALAASGLEEVQLKEFLDEMGADLRQYVIWRLDLLGWTAPEAVAMAGLEFPAYRILRVDSSQPEWLQQLLAGLEEAGILPLDDLEPAFQATERYFGGFV